MPAAAGDHVMKPVAGSMSIPAGGATSANATGSPSASVARTEYEYSAPTAPVVGGAEVTSGGVALREVDPATCESRRRPGLHLIGEVLDLDGRIGGYNFQAAWSLGWLAGTVA